MAKTIVMVNDYGHKANAPSQIAIDSALALADAKTPVLFFCAVPPLDETLLAHPRVRTVCTGQIPIGQNPRRMQAALQGLWNTKARHLLHKALTGLSPEDTVVHIHLWNKALSPSILAEVARFGAPVFVTAHEYYTVCPNGGLLHYPTGAICTVRPLSAKCVLARCDRRSYPQKLWRVARQALQNQALSRIGPLTLLAPSRLCKAVLAQHLPGRDIRYLPNFVRTLHGASAAISYEDNRPYLFIGRLEPEKGIELFCQALVELVLPGIAVGGAPIAAEENRLKAQYPGVHFTGHLPWADIAPLVAKSRALVFPSLWHEGMGLVPFEVQQNFAMPCIVASQSAPRQLVREGKSGLLFQTGSLADLKRALVCMQDNALVASMHRNIVGEDFSAYSLENHITALLQLYQAAVKGRDTHA